MGLAERRIIIEFQKSVFPGLKKQIEDAGGFEVPVEVDWEKLAQPNCSHRYLEDWAPVFFEPVIQALQSIGADDLGKQTLKDSLKKVEITCAEPEHVSFQDGLLKIEHRFVNSHNVIVRKEAIVAVLAKASKGMGLFERRILTRFQKSEFPGLKKQIEDAAGFEVPIEVAWEKLAELNDPESFMEQWRPIFFVPVIQALQSIGADDLGKEALRDGLKKVEITCGEPEHISFQDGVLKIEHRYVNSQNVIVRKNAIVALMEKAL